MCVPLTLAPRPYPVKASFTAITAPLVMIQISPCKTYTPEEQTWSTHYIKLPSSDRDFSLCVQVIIPQSSLPKLNSSSAVFLSSRASAPGLPVLFPCWRISLITCCFSPSLPTWVSACSALTILFT